jgi:hypothetical protein
MRDANSVEFLKKLKALADRGVGGERDSAQKLLEKLMVKYHVQEADLSDEQLEDYDFHYHNKYEKSLLVQTISKFAHGRKVFRYTCGKGSRTIRIVRCTKAEALQIQIAYDFYVELWNEELDVFLEAFIRKHDILDSSPGANQVEISEEHLERLAAMMAGLQDRPLNKMLESGERDS